MPQRVNRWRAVRYKNIAARASTTESRAQRHQWREEVARRLEPERQDCGRRERDGFSAIRCARCHRRFHDLEQPPRIARLPLAGIRAPPTWQHAGPARTRAGEHPRGIVALQNLGQNAPPTTLLAGRGSILSRLERREGTLNQSPSNAFIALHSAATTSNKSLWYDRALTPAEIAELAAGHQGALAYGRIEYQDAFQTRRWSNFRAHDIPESVPAACGGFRLLRSWERPNQRCSQQPPRAEHRPVAPTVSICLVRRRHAN